MEEIKGSIFLMNMLPDMYCTFVPSGTKETTPLPERTIKCANLAA